jgi:hypothetical protein
MTVALLAALALAGAATAVVLLRGAAGAQAGTTRLLFKASVSPSETGYPDLHGVHTDDEAWLINSGSVRLLASGELLVKIQGLVVPGIETAGPVTTVDASIYCANETTPYATTPSVPISTSGDATIATTIALKGACLAPIVLINPNEDPTTYIAESGFGKYGVG